jgi:replicative DNA helicase
MNDIHYAPSADFLSRKASQVPNMLRAGRIPPQAIDMEQVVLGAIMNERGAIDRVVDILDPDHMYSEKHKLIYAACLSLKGRREPIDLLSVKNQLQQDGHLEAVGNVYYLTELTSKVANSANIEYHSSVIVEKYRKREGIKMADKMVVDGFNDTVTAESMFDDMAKSLSQSTLGVATTIVHMPDMEGEAIDRYERNMRLREESGGNIVVVGVSSGLNDLDRITGGYQDGHLIIIAGRPSMGKTRKALNTANTAAKAGVQVLIFSLEMTKEDMMDIIAGERARVDPRNAKYGNISIGDLSRLRHAINGAKGIHIDDTPAVSLSYVRRVSRLMRKKCAGRMIVIIDYLQLMSPSDGARRSGNREQEVAEISKGLKELAKELKCPVVALAQLSRSVETRGGDKKPMLSDLRESGGIEQDADIVIFCYRPMYYDITEFEDGSSTNGIGILLISKNRHGPLGEPKFLWEPTCRGWMNLDSGSESDFPDPRRVKPIVDTTIPRHHEDQPSGGDFFPF